MASLKGLTVPTILVADDNSNIQKMVSLVFKEKGIHVVAVGNGEAACRKVPEVHPDVVLADVFMPVRNGYEVCEFVKQDPQFAETPVILLVGAFDPLDEKEAQRVGANGVLKKPFVPPEPLITMVSSMLKIEPAAEAPPPPAPDEASMPQSPAKSGPTARERAIASAQAQYAEMGEDEAVTTYGAPVAMPSSQDQEIEEADLDPASEWTKRRASMDYEIDAADSANMVEKLAAQGSTAEEPEIQAASKHLPFGGANIEGTLDRGPVESSPAAWAESASEISVEPSSPELHGAEKTEEFSLAPAVQEQETSTYADERNASRIDPPMTFLRVPPPKEPDIPSDTTTDSQVEPLLETLPETQLAESAIEAQSTSESFESFSEPDTKSSFAHEELLESFTSGSPSAPSATRMTVGQASPSIEHIESAAEEVQPRTPVDQATVDEVVAKVISKLEPQLHQALANGVLRPLVEELLNQQREKK